MGKIKEFIKEHKLITTIGAGVTLVGGAALWYAAGKRPGAKTGAITEVTKTKIIDLPIPALNSGTVEELWDESNQILTIGHTTRDNIGKFFEELYEKVDALDGLDEIALGVVGFSKERITD